MKRAILLAIIGLFAASSVFAQTADRTPERTADVSEVEELRNVSRLPEAARDARSTGTEEEEIQNVVKSVQEKKLTPQEGANTIKIMKENTADGVSNKGISGYVVEQKAKGVQGEELGQAVKTELQARHRVRVEEQKGEAERKEEHTGKEAEVHKESEQKAKSEAKAADGGDQSQKGEMKKPHEEQPAPKGKGKGK
ncbi:MAG: hypothetical protein JSW49_08215 [candidate division WOR-3 bacterium]|nr:MAG: hypothetical protein JSW49_08215 [candidate division WOR-3 bacterium]